MAPIGGQPINRRKQPKSRTGCSTCKAKRLKCDETKPICIQCSKRRVKCGGYVRDLKWRSFDVGQQGGMVILQSNDNPPLNRGSLSDNSNSISPSQSGNIDEKQTPINIPRSPSSVDLNSIPDDPSLWGPDSLPDPAAFSGSGLSPLVRAINEGCSPRSYPNDIGQGGGRSPLDSGRSPADPSWNRLSPVSSFLKLNSASPEAASCMEGLEPRNDMSPESDDNISDLNAGSSLGQFTPIGSPSVPYAIMDVHEQIFRSYERYTSVILCIKADCNPWLETMWPLACTHKALYHAIAAMTSFHVARTTQMHLRMTGLEHVRHSLTELSNGLIHQTMSPEVALATTLVLAWADVFDNHTSTGFKHIVQSRALVKTIFKAKGADTGSLLRDPKFRFLYNTWLYIDALAQVTTSADSTNDEDFVSNISAASNRVAKVDGDDDDETGPDVDMRSSQIQFHCFQDDDKDEKDREDDGISAGFSPVSSSYPETARTSPKELLSEHGRPRSSSETINKKPGLIRRVPSPSIIERPSRMKSQAPNLAVPPNEVDALLGCSQTLFPLIGRVAILVRKMRSHRQSSRIDLDILSTAMHLRSLLDSWQPATPQFVAQQDENLAGYLATAEAYRLATLMYLHQAVPELPSPSSHSLARQVFSQIDKVPIQSRVCVVHVFPLLLAGCEAIPGTEREWVEARWSSMMNCAGLGNIERAYDVMSEVWRRRDLRRRRAKERWGLMGINNKNRKSSIFGLSTTTQQLDSSSNSDANNFSATVGPDGDEIEISVSSSLHWSAVMSEWGWEVLLG